MNYSRNNMEKEPIHPAEEIDKEAKTKAARDVHMPIIRNMVGLPEVPDDDQLDKPKTSSEHGS